jgi:hypothetical protein
MKTMTEDCGNIGLGSGLTQRGSQTKWLWSIVL